MSIEIIPQQKTQRWLPAIYGEGPLFSNRIIEPAKNWGKALIHVLSQEDVLSHPLTHLFVGIVFKYCLQYVFPAIRGVVPDYLLVSLPLLAERVWSWQNEALYLRHINILENENQELNNIHTRMNEQIEKLKVSNECLLLEVNQAVKERTIAKKQNANTASDHSPHLAEQEALVLATKTLAQEKEALQTENQLLSGAKEEITQEKKALEEKYNLLSKELTESRLNLLLSGGYRELDQQLANLNNLYIQIMNHQRQGEAAPAVDELISSFEINKRNLHAILQTAIDGLSQNDSNRIIFEEILRLSEKEMQLPRVIIQAAHVAAISN